MEITELNDLISRKVFHVVVIQDTITGERYCYDLSGKKKEITNWAQDRNAANQLVDFLKRNGNVISIRHDGENDIWECSINGTVAHAPSYPLAVCRAVKASLP